MKRFCISMILLMSAIGSQAQTFARPDVCPSCVEDTTGGYISIDNTAINNPVCNYEHLTKAHLALVPVLKIDRATIPFEPHSLNVLYDHTGYARGHVIPFEDLAYSKATAVASMNLTRNLAKEPQPQNIGTEYASEQFQRKLANQYGSVSVWAGCSGTYETSDNITAPIAYWKIIRTPAGDYIYWMPTHAADVSFEALDKCCGITFADLLTKLGFDPTQILKGE